MKYYDSTFTDLNKKLMSCNFFCSDSYKCEVSFRSYRDGKNERPTFKREIRGIQENYLSSESKKTSENEAHLKTRERERKIESQQ